MGKKIGQAVVGGMFITVGVIDLMIGTFVASGATVTISKED